jgi:ribosomal protein L35
MTKVKKIKKKTHKGLKKVLNVRKSGSISIAKQGILHNTGKNSAKRSRKKRLTHGLHKSDLSRVKDLI